MTRLPRPHSTVLFTLFVALVMVLSGVQMATSAYSANSSQTSTSDTKQTSTSAAKDSSKKKAKKKSSAKKSAKNKAKKSAKKSKAAKKAKARKARKAAELKARNKARQAPELKTGSRGKAVVKLQRLLRKNGYWVQSVDGKYGHSTQQAVMAVQKSTGRARTGRATMGVWYELYLGSKPATQISRAQSKNRTIYEIDLSMQVLSLVRNGKVVKTFNISSGSNSYYTHRGRRIFAHTPTGTFKVYMRRNYLHQAELGPMYRPQYYLSGGWAIHGSPNIPAYAASHGCIRIANPAMDYLWDYGLGIGSVIVIHK